MPPAYEILLLNTAVPQIQAAQSGDTYVVPRDIAFSAVANLANGTYLLPALAFSSDPDTGIFRQGANALGFVSGGGADQMVLTTTGLGIGTNNPAQKLDVFGNGMKVNNASYAGYIGADSVFGSSGVASSLTVRSDNALTFSTGGPYTRATLDSSGNLGLGVTPSAWSGFTAFDIANVGTLATYPSFGVALLRNTYYDGSNYRYKISSAASYYDQDANGKHQWFTAPSGTAGNAITFTQAMTLLANGNLGIGETNPGYKLQVIGTSQLSLSAAGTQQALQLNNNDTTAGTQAVKLGFSSSGVTKASINAAVYGNDYMTFNVGSDTERARITSGGDFQTSSGGSVQVGGTAARATTAGTNRLDIFDGTAPVGTLANGVSFYSTAGEARVMDAAGNATLLSPHDTETNEWIFHSKHTPTGKVLRIDVERLLKFVNDHFGLDAVQEFIEE